MFYNGYFKFLCTLCFSVFLVFLDVECDKRYDIVQEAILLYNMDIGHIIKKFRHTADYAKILDDKKQESEKFVQDTFISLFQGYHDKMKEEIKKDFPYDKLSETITSTTDVNKCNFRSILNSTKSGFTIVNGKVRRVYSDEVGPREEIQRLENYPKRHSPLKLHERNKYKDLGFNYAKQVIKHLIKAMGGGDESKQRSTRQVEGGYDHHQSFSTTEYTELNEHNNKESNFDPDKVKESVSDKIKQAKDGVNDRIKDAKDAVDDKIEEAKNAVNDRIKDAEDKIEEAKNAVTNRIKDAKDAVDDKVEEAEDAIADGVKDAKDAVNDKISEVTLPTIPTGINVKFGRTLARRGLPYNATKKSSTLYENVVQAPVKLISLKDPSSATKIALKTARRYGNINSVLRSDHDPENEYSDTDKRLHELKSYLDRIWKEPEIQHYTNRKVSESKGHTPKKSHSLIKNLKQDKQQATINMSKQLISRALMIKNVTNTKSEKIRNSKNKIFGSKEQAIANFGSLPDTMQDFYENEDDAIEITKPKVSLKFRTYQKGVMATSKSYNMQKTKKLVLENKKDESLSSEESNYSEDLKQINERETLELKWNYTDNLNDDNGKAQKNIAVRADWDYDSRQKPEVAYKTLDKLTRRSDNKPASKNKNNLQIKSGHINKNKYLSKKSTSLYRRILTDNTNNNPSLNSVIVEDKVPRSPDRNIINSNIPTKSKTKKIIIWDGRYTNSIEKNSFPLNSIERKLLDEDSLLKLSKNRKMDSMMNNIWKQRLRYGKSRNLWDKPQPFHHKNDNEGIYKKFRKNIDYVEVTRNEENKVDNKDHNARKKFKVYHDNDKKKKEKWSQLIRNSWESIQIS